jgi:hypothetical protein
LKARSSVSPGSKESGGVGKFAAGPSADAGKTTLTGIAGLISSSMEAEKGFSGSMSNSGKIAAIQSNSIARSSSMVSRMSPVDP